MSKYRKKPVIVEATQWWNQGDHPAVIPFRGNNPNTLCQHCSTPLKEHGQCPTLEGWHIVCPGDWIITGVKGEHYPCKPDIFEETYELLEET